MIRELRVGYQTGRYDDSKRPQIKLAGVWLSEAGFHYGERLLVTVQYGRLVIEKVTDQAVDSDE